MNRTWLVRRDTVARLDGQHRWDRAYQLLLQWADEAPVAQPPVLTQEDDDAHCPVCPGLDQSPAAEPSH